MAKLAKYTYRLTQVCSHFHEKLTGTLVDGWSKEDARMLRWLRARVNGWVPAARPPTTGLQQGPHYDIEDPLLSWATAVVKRTDKERAKVICGG